MQQVEQLGRRRRATTDRGNGTEALPSYLRYTQDDATIWNWDAVEAGDVQLAFAEIRVRSHPPLPRKGTASASEWWYAVRPMITRSWTR